MAMLLVAVSFAGYLTNVPVVDGAKMLVYGWNVFSNSAMRNMEKMAAIIAEEGGHEITILSHSNYKLENYLKILGIKLISHPRHRKLIKDYDSVFKNLSFSLWNISEEREEFMLQSVPPDVLNCQSLISAKEIMQRLLVENYDLLFYDGADECGRLLASYLHNVPSIAFLTTSAVWRWKKMEYPLPLSYLPIPFVLEAHVRMSFSERLCNVLAFLIYRPLQMVVDDQMRAMAKEYGIEQRQVDSLGFVFGGFPVENPAPILPDMVFLDAALLWQPKSLPTDVKNFLQLHSNLDIIVCSLGSTIKAYGEFYTNLFAECFKRLPYVVIWRLPGQPPKTLGQNIMVMKSIPQVELLAHPRTKLFITHGGINSMYEAVRHAVPIIAIPVYGDQHSNAEALTNYHNIGVKLPLDIITPNVLESTVQEVVKNSTYKHNAVKLSQQLSDKPISGRTLIMFWVEYMLRHKTAKHLKAQGRDLPLYQFYLVDVMFFLCIIVIVLVFVCYCLCKLLFDYFRKTTRLKQLKIKCN